MLVLCLMAVIAVVLVGGWWLGVDVMMRVRRFADAAGLVTRTTDTVSVDGRTSTSIHYPRVRRVRRPDGHIRFILWPAAGLTVGDYVEKAAAMAAFFHAAEVVITPAGVGDHAVVSVNFRDSIPSPFRIRDLWDAADAAHADDGLIPLGFTDTGDVFYAMMSHLLVVGQTGSGKGSMIWSMVMGIDHVVGRCGQHVRFYGIDPKWAELAGVHRGFERVAFDPDDQLDLLTMLVEEMRRRQGLGLRSFDASSLPWLVLVIDEFNAIEASSDLKWKREVKALLSAVLSQGRSAGIVVVAAAQQGQRDAIGPYRDHFVTRVCLRVGSRVETDVVLGSGAVEAGALPHEIPPATVSNNYRTAGVGYGLSLSVPGYLRFRAPLVTDADIRAWDDGQFEIGGHDD